MSNNKSRLECSEKSKAEGSEVRPRRSGPPPIPKSYLKDVRAKEPLADDGQFKEGNLTDGILRYLSLGLTVVAVLLSSSILLALSRSQRSIVDNLASVRLAKNTVDESSIQASELVGESAVNSDSLLAFGQNDSDLQAAANDVAASIATNNSEVKPAASEPTLPFELPIENGNSETDETQKPDGNDDSELLIVIDLFRTPNQSPEQQQAEKQAQESVAMASCEADNNQPNAKSNSVVQKEKPEPISAPYYGTKIKWHRLVDDAVKEAKNENKPIFLIHVSGNFTKEEFT